MPRPISGPNQFWANVDVRGITECWNWQRTKTKEGHGRTTCIRLTPGQTNKLLYAHHIAFAFTHGELPPKGWCLHHVCENPACVNPTHLLLMTRGHHNRVHKLGGTYIRRTKEQMAADAAAA